MKYPVFQIRPSRGFRFLNFNDLWEYRELLYFFIWREIKVRYKQTVIGFAWAIIQPLLMMVLFTLFFGKLAKIPSEGIPYAIFSYTALLPWTLFSESILRSTNSLIQDANLVRKIYFPRILAPVSGTLSPVVDFAIAFVILIGMMFCYGYYPTLKMLYLPLFILLALATALGVGLWLSAINIKYRDVRYVTPFLVQLWLFASPVVYSSKLIPQRFQAIYGLNPMAGVIEGFRWVLLGTSPPNSLIAVSVIVTAVMLISGIFYFQRTERSFADYI